MRALTAFFATALTMAAAAAAAETGATSDGPAAQPFKLQVDLPGRLNPWGVVLQIGGNYRRELGPPHRSRPRPYLQGGLGIGVTPASATASAYVDWMQAPFLVLRVRSDLYRYFGTNGMLLEFPGRDSPFGSDAIDSRSGHELSRFAGRLLLQPTLRARLGPLFVQCQTDLAWFHFGKGGPYFYERGYDTLLQDGDGVVASRTTVLAPVWSDRGHPRLLAGPAYELQRSFVAGLQRQRLGAAFQFSPNTRLGPLARPRIAVQAGVYIQDQNRQGQPFTPFQVGADLESR